VAAPEAHLARLPAAAGRSRTRGIPRSATVRPLALLGPGFVAAVAYVDPGNFVINFQSGTRQGYLLVWVIVAANIVAMLVQYLSAKLGLASGKNLPEACRAVFHPVVVFFLWIQAEIVVIATDLAEFVGAAVALNLFFGMSMTASAAVTAVASTILLALNRRRSARPFELAILALLTLIAVVFCYSLCTTGRNSAGDFMQGMVPHLEGPESLVLAVGITGATVMPHVVYLHSALTQNRVAARDPGEVRRLLRYLRLDCGVGLGGAGLLNVMMLAVAAALFHGRPDIESGTLAAVDHGFATVLGGGASLMFCLALFASGLSSSSVGTYAGQVVMQGFTGVRIPVLARRVLTVLPSLAVLALGLPADTILVLSQVVLCFGIPFALVPLVLLTRRTDLLGPLANRRRTTLAASVCTALITGLNAYLLYALTA
jgi:manganese transport protein